MRRWPPGGSGEGKQEEESEEEKQEEEGAGVGVGKERRCGRGTKEDDEEDYADREGWKGRARGEMG